MGRPPIAFTMSTYMGAAAQRKFRPRDPSARGSAAWTGSGRCRVIVPGDHAETFGGEPVVDVVEPGLPMSLLNWLGLSIRYGA